jgi:diguanylate cyclase (GGDEF)-like protein/putative nucleotidyltransferase with HDIG domain
VGPEAQEQHVRPDEGSPGSRENALALRSLTPAIAARAQAYLFASAGLVGALGVLLPHPARFEETHMLAVQLSSVASALVLFLLPRFVPRWFLAIGPYTAAVATSMAVVFSGEGTSAYLLFYLWVAFYAFYFLPRWEAIGLAVFTVANYAAVLTYFRVAGAADGSPSNGDISAMVLTTGTVACAGVFILLLRERVGGLIRQLTELARSERSGRPFSLLLGDCDFFKSLNDSLGHHAGDQALIMIGRMLEGDKRRIDVAARIGGEEFALVLPDADHHDAYLTAERLRTRFAEVFASQPIPLTMSFGVATYPLHGGSADSLMRAADEALYAAKALGRNRSVLHSDEIEGILAARKDEQRDGEDAQLSTVVNLAQALDMRDSGTARHSQTVGHLCELMGHELGLNAERTERLRLAGLLHDIGKIGVPDSILQKPGPLTTEERDQMKKHPEIGARILGGSGLDDIRNWVLAHHERPDGSGYPHGLAETEIPLEAKILAVADAFEAMTADRVYRRAIGLEAARDELRAGAGTQFDPRVVMAFLHALERESGRGVAAIERSAGIAV